MPVLIDPITTPLPSGQGAYTFKDLKNAVEFAAAGSLDQGVTPPRVSSGQIVNRAISYLEAAFPWSWLRAITTLDLNANVSTLTLPSGLSEIMGLQTTANPNWVVVRRVSPDEYMRYLAYPFQGVLRVYMTLGMAPVTDAGTERLKQIAVAPVPTTNQTAALRLMYIRSIFRFVTDATDTSQDDYLADVPQNIQDVLMSLCRAFAISTEDEQVGSAWQEAKDILAQAIAQEQRSDEQSDSAPASTMRHNVPRRYTWYENSEFNRFWFSTVNTVPMP